MASSSTVPAPAATPQMKPLPAWLRILLKIGLFLGAVFVCIGIGGILVITDKDEKMWLSKTPFGDGWRYLMSLNAIFIPAVMNAGILSLLLCGHNLQYDHKARLGDAPKKVSTTKAPKKKTRAKKVD